MLQFQFFSHLLLLSQQFLHGMQLSNFFIQLFIFRFFFCFFLFGPNLLEFFGGLVGRPFSLGPQKLFKESLFVSYDSFLIINLLFVLRQPLSSDQTLLVLDLLYDQVAHEGGRPLLNCLLYLRKQVSEVCKLLVKSVDLLLLNFAADSLEIEGGRMKDILDVTGQFGTFPLKFYNPVHVQNLELLNITKMQVPHGYSFKSSIFLLFTADAERRRLWLNYIVIFRSMEPALQIRLPIYILIGATTILGTLLFMNWTADNGLANFVRYFYNQNEIKTFNQELKIVINTVYYFSLLVIIFYGIGAVYSLAKKKDEDNAAEPQFTQTTNEALSIGFQVFLIFVAFFYYLLNNDGDDLPKRYINLLPFWFLTSWVVYMLGAWLSRWAQLKLYISGVIMVIILWILILGEIYKNGFIPIVLNL